jgi:NTE family protein
MELKLDPSKEYAVALEGGGAKGAYQIGAWKALKEAGIRYNAVSGSSVGSLNGAMMAMGDLDKAVSFWQNIRFSQVMNVDDAMMRQVFQRDFKNLDVKALMKGAVDTIRQGGFDVEPLKALLKEAIDEDKVLSSPIAFFLMTYSVSDHKELDIDVKSLQKGELYDMLLASAYFPAFKHEKLGGKLYTDGGVQDVVPIHSLTSRGYKDLIVIRIFGVGVERRFRIPPDVNMVTIAPNEDLGSVLNFSSQQSRYDMRLGYYDAKRVLYGLYGHTYYLERTLDEESAYDRLLSMVRHGVPGLTLRECNEKAIPGLARLSGGAGDYYGVYLSVLEAAAKELVLDPFSIRTEEALYQEIQAKACGLPGTGISKLLSYIPVEDCLF